MIRLFIDFGDLRNKTVADLGEGFTGSLQRHLPGLERHTFGNEKQGQFIERMTHPESVPIPELTWRIALELQLQIGAKVSLGGAYPTDSPTVQEIAYAYEDAEVGKQAGIHALGLIHHLLPANLKRELRPPINFNFDTEPKPLREIAQRRAMDINTVYLLQAAQRRGIPWSRVDSKICQLGQGRYRRYVRSAATGLQPLIGFKMTEDKAITVSILGELGLPVPRQVLVRTTQSARNAASRIGYPVVVKPQSSYTGLGVSTRLTDPEQIDEAFHSAQKYSNAVIVESFIEGDDHRLLVVGGAMVAAVKRVPAHVVGDGEHSVRQLVDLTNRRRRARGRKPKYDIKLDEVAEWHMRRAGYCADSVPGTGERVFLRSASNYSQGGYAIDVTVDVHPDNRILAIQATRAFDLDVAGVDFITTDISRSYKDAGGAICEVGTRPGLLLHMSPDIGPARDVATPIVNLLYPPGHPARIPVIAIAGSRLKRSTGRVLAHLLTLGGYTVGLASKDQTYVGGIPLFREGQAVSDSTRTLLGNPEVDAAILEISFQQLNTVGLGYDRSSVGIFTSAGDLQDKERIPLADALKLIADSASKGIVINADDALCAQFAAGLTAASTYMVAATPGNVTVQRHIESGGRAVRVETTTTGDGIVLYHEGRQIWSLPLSVVPMTNPRNENPSLPQSALFAIAAAWAMGLPFDCLRDGLATLTAAAAREVSSLRILRGGPFPIVLADLDRADTLAAAVDAAERIKPECGATALITGLTISDDIAQFSSKIMNHFERFLCVSEQSAAQEFLIKASAVGQPADALCHALHQSGIPSKDARVYQNLSQALETCNESGQDRGLLMVFTRDVANCQRMIESVFSTVHVRRIEAIEPSSLPKVSATPASHSQASPLPLWSGPELAAATNGVWVSGPTDGGDANGVTYFLWETKPGDLVIATNPDQWARKYANLHQRIPELFERGAAAVIVSEVPPPGLPQHYPLLKVDNTWAALNDLGKAARDRLIDTGVIAVTGSVGKTTTTEAIFHLLGQQAKTFATHKNYNSTPGVPVTLARTPRDVRYAVYEFGIGRSHPANILRSKMIRPHVAVITAIEPDHLAFYGTLEEIVDAKTKLFEGLEPGGTAILNRDTNLFELQLAIARQQGVGRIVTFGENAEADVRLVEATLTADGGSALAMVHGQRVQFSVPQPGRHMLLNGLAAIAAVEAIGADWRRAAHDLGSLPPVPGRANVSKISLGEGSYTLIEDAYSANTGSIRSAITLLDLTEPAPGRHRYAILGEMKELGPTSPQIHASLAPAIVASRADLVFTIGDDMKYLRDALPAAQRGQHGDNPVEMAHAILDLLRDGDVVLLKGSARTPGAMKQILTILREGRKPAVPARPSGEGTVASPAPPAYSHAGSPAQGPMNPPTTASAGRTFAHKHGTEMRILFLGDTSFGENYQADIQRRGGVNVLEEHGYDYNFAHVDDFLKSADLVIANVETPVTDLKDSPLSGKKKWLHWTDVRDAPLALRRHNIQVASLANNHTFDYGPGGFEQTLRVLEQNGLHCLGAGPDIAHASQPIFVKTTCGGLPFEMAVISAYQFSVLARDGFGMFADQGKGGVNPINVAQLTSSIREVKRQNPGMFVILFLHWGNNYAWRSDFQAELADSLIEGGADLIIGHGAHMIQEIERRRNRWVVFSIGNFVFNSPGRYEKHNAPPFSFIADLRAENANNCLHLALRLFPIVTDNTLTDYQPRFVTSDEFQLLLSILKNRPCSPIDEKGEIRTGTEDGKPYLELPITEALSTNPS